VKVPSVRATSIGPKRVEGADPSVRTILRRNRTRVGAYPVTRGSQLHCADIGLDEVTHEAWKAGVSVRADPVRRSMRCVFGLVSDGTESSIRRRRR
jgi:hypothetical protein